MYIPEFRTHSHSSSQKPIEKDPQSFSQCDFNTKIFVENVHPPNNLAPQNLYIIMFLTVTIIIIYTIIYNLNDV